MYMKKIATLSLMEIVLEFYNEFSVNITIMHDIIKLNN